MNMSLSTRGRGGAFGNLAQFIEDSAVLGVLAAQAGFTQNFELPFQLAQLFDPLRHMADVFI